MMQTRRRFLAISAVALALPPAARAGDVAARWQGRALGAEASMVLSGVDPIAARPVFARLERELTRLEGIFSLHRPDSAVVRLNREGRLPGPPSDLIEVLTLCDVLNVSTGGLFDPTVQPLWQARATGGDERAARALTGWQDLRREAGLLAFTRPGMALTLNGIAQGHVADRIAALLDAAGFGDVLIDMGEIVARGARPGGGSWQAAIATPEGRIVHRVALSGRALATSAPAGTRLADGRGHIMGPGGETARHELVSVSAPRAVVADGLSTALCLMETEAAERTVASFAGARIEHIA